MYYVNDVRAAPVVKYISVLSRRNKLYFSKHCSVTMADTETSFHLRKWGQGVNGCGQETISYISNGVIQLWSTEVMGESISVDWVRQRDADSPI